MGALCGKKDDGNSSIQWWAKDTAKQICKPYLQPLDIKLKTKYLKDLEKLTRNQLDEVLLMLLGSHEFGPYCFDEWKQGCPEIYYTIWPQTYKEEHELVQKAKRSGNFPLIQAAFCSKDTFHSKLDLSSKLHFIADIYQPRDGLPDWQNVPRPEGDFKKVLIDQVIPEGHSVQRDPPIIFLVKKALDEVDGGLRCLKAYLSDPNVPTEDINSLGQIMLPREERTLELLMPPYESPALHYVIQSRFNPSHRHSAVQVLTALCRRQDLDINMKDSNGLTALQYAVERKNNVALVNRLLDAGAGASLIIEDSSEAGNEITTAERFIEYNWYHKHDDAVDANVNTYRAVAELTADENYAYERLESRLIGNTKRLARESLNEASA